MQETPTTNLPRDRERPHQRRDASQSHQAGENHRARHVRERRYDSREGSASVFRVLFRSDADQFNVVYDLTLSKRRRIITCRPQQLRPAARTTSAVKPPMAPSDIRDAIPPGSARRSRRDQLGSDARLAAPTGLAARREYSGRGSPVVGPDARSVQPGARLRTMSAIARKSICQSVWTSLPVL